MKSNDVQDDAKVKLLDYADQLLAEGKKELTEYRQNLAQQLLSAVHETTSDNGLVIVKTTFKDGFIGFKLDLKDLSEKVSNEEFSTLMAEVLNKAATNLVDLGVEREDKIEAKIQEIAKRMAEKVEEYSKQLKANLVVDEQSPLDKKLN